VVSGCVANFVGRFGFDDDAEAKYSGLWPLYPPEVRGAPR